MESIKSSSNRSSFNALGFKVKEFIPFMTNQSLSYIRKSLFDWFANTKSDFLDFEIKKIFIETPRELLLKKISIRTEQMFRNKCIDEVKKFNRLKINKNLSVNKLIGVQEINDFLKSNI